MLNSDVNLGEKWWPGLLRRTHWFFGRSQTLHLSTSFKALMLHMTQIPPSFWACKSRRKPFCSTTSLQLSISQRQSNSFLNTSSCCLGVGHGCDATGSAFWLFSGWTFQWAWVPSWPENGFGNLIKRWAESFCYSRVRCCCCWATSSVSTASCFDSSMVFEWHPFLSNCFPVWWTKQASFCSSHSHVAASLSKSEGFEKWSWGQNDRKLSCHETVFVPQSTLMPGIYIESIPMIVSKWNVGLSNVTACPETFLVGPNSGNERPSSSTRCFKRGTPWTPENGILSIVLGSAPFC